MRIHSDYMTVQTEQKREFMNITPNVKSAAEKSGIRDGIILVASLHSNSGVFINDEEAGLLQDIDEWLDQPRAVSATTIITRQGARAESNAGAHLQSILLNQQAMRLLHRRQARDGPLATGDLRRTGRHAPQAHPH